MAVQELQQAMRLFPQAAQQPITGMLDVFTLSALSLVLRGIGARQISEAEEARGYADRLANRDTPNIDDMTNLLQRAARDGSDGQPSVPVINANTQTPQQVATAINGGAPSSGFDANGQAIAAPDTGGVWEWLTGQDSSGQQQIINTGDPTVIKPPDTSILGMPRWAVIGAGVAVVVCVVALAVTGATRSKQQRTAMPDDDQ